MIRTEPQIPNDARLPIGEAAEVLGINRLTLRRKTMDGLIKCGFRRTTKNSARRFYLGSEIKRFWRSHM